MEDRADKYREETKIKANKKAKINYPSEKSKSAVGKGCAEQRQMRQLLNLDFEKWKYHQATST